MVGAAGFELATYWSQTSCATRLRYAPKTQIVPRALTVLELINNDGWRQLPRNSGALLNVLFANVLQH